MIDFWLESGYFAVNEILPLEAILPSSFMCVQIAIFSMIVAVILWCSG